MISDGYVRYLVPSYNPVLDPAVYQPEGWELRTKDEVLSLLELGELNNLDYELEELHNKYMECDASVGDLLDHAIVEGVINVMVEGDIDDVEEIFRCNYNEVSFYSFGAYCEWEIMEALEPKIYKQKLDFFIKDNQESGYIFYEQSTGIYWLEDK